MLPTFLVIGAMKCGTTSLYHYLAEHPEIGMSRRKETDFFIAGQGNWNRGRDWYRRQFPEAPARGECSPNYTKRHLFESVPERIDIVCPEVQLIYLVRDPIERAISHYRGSCRQGREDRSFGTAIAELDANNYVLTSRYHFQLQPYLDRFPKQNLLVLSTEELGTAPVATLQEVYQFLGVDPTFEGQRPGEHYNPSASKKKLGPWTRRLSAQIPQPLKDQVRPHLPLHWLPGKRIPRPDVAPSLRAQLEETFRSDVEALRKLTGHDFDAWSV